MLSNEAIINNQFRKCVTSERIVLCKNIVDNFKKDHIQKIIKRVKNHKITYQAGDQGSGQFTSDGLKIKWAIKNVQSHKHLFIEIPGNKNGNK